MFVTTHWSVVLAAAGSDAPRAQVEQAQAPPHSAAISGMSLRRAVSMTVEPVSPSTVRAWPCESTKVILAFVGAPPPGSAP